MPFVSIDQIVSFSDCTLDNGNCHLVIPYNCECCTQIAVKGDDMPDLGTNDKTPLFPFGFEERKKITGGGGIMKRDPSHQSENVFHQENVYCVFEGAIDVKYKDGTFQKVLPCYTTEWNSYADVWTYNKKCKIGGYRATFFAALLLGETNLNNYTVKARILDNDFITEPVPPGSILGIAAKPNNNQVLYQISEESKTYSSIYHLDKFGSQISVRSIGKSYLILLTPKS